MVWQPTIVVDHKHVPPLQLHVLVLHPSPVDLKKVSEEAIFLQYLSPAGSDQDSMQFVLSLPRFTCNIFRSNKNTNKK